MARMDEETQAIMSASMKHVKYGDRSELEQYSLSALKKADYQLDWRDEGSGYRKAITDLINELEKEEIPANQADMIDVKPNLFGLGVNLNEVWRRVNPFKK